VNPGDYGLWLGEEADQLLGQFREVADRAHRYGPEEMVAKATADQLKLLAEIRSLAPEVKDCVIMDLLVTVANLESGLLHYQMPQVIE
jgi:hypothetical protein